MKAIYCRKPCRFHLFMIMDSLRFEYESPEIEMIKIKVEQGYSASGNDNNGGGIPAPGWG